MDLLLILTYAAICWTVFKVFRIPVNQWTLATAVLGGVFLIGALLLLMSYNHPYSSDGRIYFTSTPVIPVVGASSVSTAIASALQNRRARSAPRLRNRSRVSL